MSDNREMIVLNGEQIDELVRCKDCKWYTPAKNILKYNMPTGYCNYHAIYPAKNDFCSKAERREDDDSDTDSDDI